MSLERLDLNLLLVFESLDAERHVTKAAARLGLTQPAMSNALRRLRTAFDDDLFQRTPTGMQPTALARELAGPVGEALALVRGAMALNRPFEPGQAVASFVVGMSDYAELVLMPPLMTTLQATAPGVSLVVRHADRETALELLDADRAQLAIGGFPEPPPRMTRVVLFRDELMALLRPEHPAAQGQLDLERFLAFAHLLVSPVASREGAVDRALAGLGRTRRLAAVVSHHLAVAPILRGSDLFCTMARRIARPLAAAFGLVVRPLPPEIVLSVQTTSLVFHNRYAQRPDHRWLRAQIARTARGLG